MNDHAFYWLHHDHLLGYILLALHREDVPHFDPVVLQQFGKLNDVVLVVVVLVFVLSALDNASDLGDPVRLKNPEKRTHSCIEISETHVAQVFGKFGILSPCLNPVGRVKESEVGNLRQPVGPAVKDVVPMSPLALGDEIEDPIAAVHFLASLDCGLATCKRVKNEVVLLSMPIKQVFHVQKSEVSEEFLAVALREVPDIVGEPAFRLRQRNRLFLTRVIFRYYHEYVIPAIKW